MPGSATVQSILENFVDDLQEQLDAQTLEQTLRGDYTPTSAELGSQPEPWIRRHLIRPLIEAVGLYWEPEIHGGGEGYPDFGITNLDIKIIGEDKAPNGIQEAQEDIEEYLNNRAAAQGAEYGIATDGINWTVIRIELGGDYLDYDYIDPTPFSFRQELLQIAHNKEYITQTGIDEADVTEKTQLFYETFNTQYFNRLLTQEAPKQLRSRKQAGIEEFYDLYVQLLFGEGSRNYDYDTTLIDDIKAPNTASDADRRKFAIKLVNRLLFVKFLEDNEVLPESFLTERVERYREAQDIDQLTGGLYKTQLQPLFYSLFNTKRENRISKHRGGWFDDVEYLNGSLFAPDEQEREFDVDDPMLITVVRDLIEGHQLDEDNGTLDPAVLGQVFEMTINHINSGQSQKDEGAYYTPSDVIQLINEKTVDPKAYEILVDAYSSRLADASNMDEETAHELVTDYDLNEMLREIEQREGYFSDPQALQEAYNRLGELKVVDPACGSGHFLTGVLDEIHRIRMSLLRGLRGDDLDNADIYQSKKELVLNAIYGVDINPIAIEIAKLRVWLKMVEEGWEQEYGELPNIDINIVPGNSLIGLPARSEGQSALAAFDLDLSSIQEIRNQYRDGLITRRELDEQIASFRPELGQNFLDQINHYVEDEITDETEWTELVAALDTLYPAIRKITLRHVDNEELSDELKTELNSAGFRVEPRFGKSAKIADEDLNTVDSITGFIDENHYLEIERQPLPTDLDRLGSLSEDSDAPDLAYEPFHWPVQFPEATVEKENGDGYEVEFDLVVGNPPYGDVQGDVEKLFTDGYKTGNINDIVGPFIERQIQILKDSGYFGNIAALLFAYQGNASSLRELMRDNFADANVACFTRRPSQVFAGSQARTGIITAEKAENEEEGSFKTSRFLRFTEDNRKEVFTDIKYSPTKDLILGDRINDGKDKSLPKIGETTLRNILQKLESNSNNVIGDVSTRSDETDHVVWRSRHPAYFINPCLENLYPEDDTPQDFDPFYFETELERRSAFLMLQSSLFYMYWMVYENERDVNWKSIDSFPLPEQSDLEECRDSIIELSDQLWEEMSNRFIGGNREMIEQAGALKPICDKIDELFRPLYDLNKEEVSFIKSYDEKYRLSDVDQTQFVDTSFEWEN